MSQQMRRGWLAGMALAGALGVSTSFAETSAAPGDGVFEAHDPRTGADTPLERVTPIEWVRWRSVGAGAGSSYLEFSGARSPVRFSASGTIEFVLRGAGVSDGTVASAPLYELDPKSDARQLQLAQAGALGPGGWKTNPKLTLPLTARKLDGGSVRLAPNAALAPGEYCLDGPGTHDGFCFGVDP